MLKYLPFVVVSIAIAPLVVWHWQMMDWVWSENIPAKQCAYLLETEIPMKLGDWVGEDAEVDEKVLEVAGADGYINRAYTNEKTGEQVSVWFIVGHFKDIAQHTPNVCYRVAGFEEVGKDDLQRIDIEGLPTSRFRTAKFRKQLGSSEHFERVFWAWWKPEALDEGQSPADVNIAWSSPEDPRLEFGFCRALYKLYFTTATDADGRADESVCLKFAEEFLPLVHDRLRTSGVVMANEELPEDFGEVVKRARLKQDADETSDGDETTTANGPSADDLEAEEDAAAAL